MDNKLDIWNYKPTNLPKLSDVNKLDVAENWAETYFWEEIGPNTNGEELFKIVKYTYAKHRTEMTKNWKDGGMYIYQTLKNLLDFAIIPPDEDDK